MATAAYMGVVEDPGIPPQYAAVSLIALRPGARIKLSQHLDLPMDIMVSEDVDLTPDYRGLAELVGFSNLEITNFPLRGRPTQALLDAWNLRPMSTIGKLWEHLATLRRFDILIDCRDCICKFELKMTV
jgi:hypothetical protein